MGASLTFFGDEEIRARLAALPAEFRPHIGSALWEEAELVVEDSRENYVPVDTGTLRDSAFVAGASFDEDHVSVTFGFSGAAHEYAIVQHERMDFKHTDGGPKFLERPLLEASKTIAERIAERLREFFR